MKLTKKEVINAMDVIYTYAEQSDRKTLISASDFVEACKKFIGIDNVDIFLGWALFYPPCSMQDWARAVAKWRAIFVRTFPEEGEK